MNSKWRFVWLVSVAVEQERRRRKIHTKEAANETRRGKSTCAKRKKNVNLTSIHGVVERVFLSLLGFISAANVYFGEVLYRMSIDGFPSRLCFVFAGRLCALDGLENDAEASVATNTTVSLSLCRSLSASLYT